ncbi:MAG: ABATE domain-containing protein [Chloroflexi bacterium]|nr:ABATE domain-containing protein [Chloroflexota bacterium]
MDKSVIFPAYLEYCLEFANTADWHASEQPVETLHSYADLVAWSQRIGILTSGSAEELNQQAARFPLDATTFLGQAIELREAIYRIFRAVTAAQSPDVADLEILNARLPATYSHLQIVQSGDHFAWGWRDEEPQLDRLLWPVVRSAADLLTFSELNRVKQCADDRGCGYFFIDTTRNHSRRWCTMESCGNRAKARRHYARQRDDA